MNKLNGKGMFYLFFNRKKLRVMRLMLFSLTVFVFQTTANTYAQMTRINLNMKQTTVKSVLKEIESKTDFSFFYNDAEMDMNRLVDVRARNENVDAILNRILPDCDYVIENKKIILIPVDKTITNIPRGNQQLTTVSGTVVDEFGDPLPGVNITILGTTQGVVTDLDGKYSISVSSDATLVFSYIGYNRQNVLVNGRSLIDVSMVEDARMVEEVVVVGFAKQKKANLTGSVSSIKVDDILGDRPITTTGNLLQGTIPGLQSTVTTGEPGAGFTFNIRGENSINGGSPLIVVDNVPYAGAIELLNPEDIESITVLKDGGAAAIYGARSAFGVILITTKGAQLNQKFQLSYNNNFTFTSPSELPVKANPRNALQAFRDMGLQSTYTGQMVDEWIGYLDEYASNPSKYPLGYVINEQGTRYSLTESDIVGDFFETGFEQKHDFSVSGGSEQMSYRVSFGYINQDGVMASKNDRFERFNFRSFLNAKFTNWLSGQVDVTHTKSDKIMPNRVDYEWAVSYPSYVEMTDLVINDEYLMAGSPANKAKYGGTNTNARSKNRITGKLIATPFRGLTVNAEYTFDDLRRTQTNYRKMLRLTNPPKYEGETLGEYSTLAKEFYRTSLNVWNIYASYNTSFGKHNLTGLLGFSRETYHYEETKNSAKDFINNELPAFVLAQEWDPITDKYTEYNTQGYFGRINYDYDNRYLLELNGRYDGSSKFPQNHRWGFFPSVSVGWNLMRESFMENLTDYIPEFKVRASYSTIGNQNVDPYQFNPNMNGEKAKWIIDGSRPTTLTTPGLVSDNFTWETVETYNLGFDISLFRNRLQGGIDYYQRNTRDMLTAAIELPAVVGANAPKQNVADLRSNGVEIEFKWNDRIGKVDYYLGFNLYNYKSKITKFDNETGLFYARNSAQDAKRYRIGMEIGEIWGYTFDRYYTVDDFVEGTLDANMKNGTLKEGVPYVEGVKPNPGDVLYVDWNEDGVINAGASTTEEPGDQKIIGNSSQKWQYGMIGGVSWNRFSFSFILQGVGKRDIWLDGRLNQPFQYEYGTIYQHQLNYWTPENTNAEFPRLYPTGNRDGNYKANFRISDRYLANGAYLRVKNLTLGYTVPSSIVRKAGLSNFRVYGSVENPFTFNHLPKGLDPTISGQGGTGMGYPVMRAYSVGFSFTL